MYEKAKEEGRPQTGRGARWKVVVPDSDEDIEDKSQLKLVKMKVGRLVYVTPDDIRERMEQCCKLSVLQEVIPLSSWNLFSSS